MFKNFSKEDIRLVRKEFCQPYLYRKLSGVKETCCKENLRGKGTFQVLNAISGTLNVRPTSKVGITMCDVDQLSSQDRSL